MANKGNKKRIIIAVASSVGAVLLILMILASSFFGVLLLRKNVVAEYEMAVKPTVSSFHTDLQAGFLNDKYYWHVAPYAEGRQELSRPNPTNIVWNVALPEDDYYVKVSENQDMADYLLYFFDIDEQTNIYNLKLGTVYYCELYDEPDLPVLDSKTLITDAEAPRNMYVDGVTNVRDLGGWAVDGGRVKQGLIYRCGRLNENDCETPVAKITEKGVYTMLNEMNIRSEIDLRKVSDNEVGGLTTESILGAEVNYYQCPMGYNGNMLINNEEMIKHIFS